MNPHDHRLLRQPDGRSASPPLLSPTGSLIGEATFTAADQDRFASLSGDFNPMHMDALAARRTQAGAPVVHGVHSMLRALDLLAAHDPALPPVATLKASFNKLTYVGDTVHYRLSQMSDKAAVIDALVEGTEVLRLSLAFGPESAAPAPQEVDRGTAVARPAEAQDLTMARMEGLAGQVGAAAGAAEIAAAFPHAARVWPAPRLLAALCTTVLVGMVCPGLHSIYSTLTLHACPAAPPDTLAFRVTRVDPRFRLARMAVQGAGVWGSIDSFVRMPPTAQAAIGELARLVRRDEFAGATALVIGGSRGLGELTAKFLAAGGAEVIITYAAGQADAEACAGGIRAWGGKCATMRYDARAPAAPQLAALPAAPTHLYYFATPQIAQRKAELFVATRYAELHTFYVTGFYEAFRALHAAAPDGLTAFYPSTVFVQDRPAEMTEYAMAKMAGEVLAADLTAHLPNARVVVSRLPRLPTDQTATVIRTETEDPIAVMLPIIRDVQRA